MRAAFFDLDGTVIRCTSLLSFQDFMAAREGPGGTPWTAQAVQAAAQRMAAEGCGREQLNAWFYRQCFAGLDVQRVRGLAQQWFDEVVLGGGLACGPMLAAIEAHRRHGQPCVFLTGSCSELVAPIVRAFGFSDAICAPLRIRDGRYTGDMDGPPCIGAGKAVHLEAYAQRHGIDLGVSAGYGDDITDAAFLRRLGQANVLSSGDPRLVALARQEGWNIV